MRDAQDAITHILKVYILLENGIITKDDALERIYYLSVNSIVK